MEPINSQILLPADVTVFMGTIELMENVLQDALKLMKSGTDQNVCVKPITDTGMTSAHYAQQTLTQMLNELPVNAFHLHSLTTTKHSNVNYALQTREQVQIKPNAHATKATNLSSAAAYQFAMSTNNLTNKRTNAIVR